MSDLEQKYNRTRLGFVVYCILPLLALKNPLNILILTMLKDFMFICLLPVGRNH